MATVFVFLESLADTPLTGASPTLTYWSKAVPGTPVASGVAMTELVGAPGGGYFVDVAVVDGEEYLGIVDGTSSAVAGGRFHLVVFSGTTDTRIEVDIPAIPVDVWDLDISAETNIDLTGGTLNLLRKGLTNRLDLVAGNPGKLILRDDDDSTLLTWDEFNALGGAIVIGLNAPARRLKAV